METELEIARAFIESHPDEAALSMERIPIEDVTALVSEMPVVSAAHVILRMAPYFGIECLKNLPIGFAGEVLARMPRDHSALLLRRMRPDHRNRLLGAIPPNVSTALTLLLQFPEDTAGALMDPEVLALPCDIEVSEALSRVRYSGTRIFYYVYVIDRDRRLSGVLNLRELMEAPGDKRLDETMHRQVARLSVHADRIAMRAHPGWLDYYALPVVSDEGVLVGVLRFKRFRASDPESMNDPATRSPLAVGLAFGELYWSTLGQLIRALWPAVNPSSEVESEEPDGQ